MTLPIVRSVRDLRAAVRAWRGEGASVGIVPTMGALHEGHLSLIRAARARAGRVLVTIFVNPKQFNRPGDLAGYPRTEAADVAKVGTAGGHLIFAPGAEEVYPAGFATNVAVGGVTEGLCGAARPGHFDGVATVVTKLFLQSGADLAFFGEKDFQQLLVVRRLARDLDIPIEVVGCPTVREADGLALSSRNQRLTPEQRRIAPQLARTLFEAKARLEAGEEAAAVLRWAGGALERAGFAGLDYLELRAEADLAPLARPDRPARLLAAAWLGEVRLIDNVRLAPRS